MPIRGFATSAIALLLLAPLVGTVPTPPAQAADSEDPSWTGPSRLTGYAERVDVTTNGRGEAFATVLSNGVGGFTRRPDGNWNRWVGDDGGAGPWNGAVIDRHGNTTVAWMEGGECGGFDDETSWEDEPFRIATAYRRAGKSFRSMPLSWESETCSGRTPELAVDAAGTVTMLFQDGDRILATSRAAGAAWESPVQIARGDRFDLAIGSAGEPLAAWTTREGAVMSSARTNRGTWTEPALVGSADDQSGNEELIGLELARTPDGAVRVLWLERLTWSGPYRLRSAVKPADQGWGGPQLITETQPDEVIKSPALAVTRESATAGWYQCGPGTGCEGKTKAGSVTASTFRGGRWSSPIVLDDAARSQPGAVSLAANSLGVMAVWKRGSHTYAALQPNGARWRAATRISRSGASGPLPARVIAYRPDMFTAIFRDGDVLAFADYVDDRVAPTARVTQPRPPFEFSRLAFIEWDTTDDRTGMATVDVRIRTAGRDGSFSRWSMWLRRAAADQHGLRFKPGQTRCLAVRARDHQGNLGRWSRQHCVTAAVDDRGLARSKGWSNLANREAYESTLTRTRRHGARLTLRGVGARQVSLVARTCPGCGVVTVTHAGHRLGRIDLSSPRVRDRRVFRLKPRARLIRGPVVVRVVSRGKPVQIDSLIARP